MPTDSPTGGELLHRIGGSSLENLHLKPREAALDIPGISVIKARRPGDAANEIRTGLPKAFELHKQANMIVTASAAAIRSTGFEVIPVSSTALPNHYRIIHPDGIAAFADDNLVRLTEVFHNSTGH